MVDNEDVKQGFFEYEYDDRDYHWYRQNSDGTWSHKPGGTEITNLDGSNNLIYDPSNCNRQNPDDSSLNYSIFIGYYAVSPWYL